jgi:hypothetical protein
MRRLLAAAGLATLLTACTPTGATEPTEPPSPPAPVIEGASTAVGPMTMPRAAHTATALADGRVLIAGGCTANGCEGTPDGGRTEFYEPSTHRFAPGPPMIHGRVGHTATPLADGRILFTGGWPDEGRPPLASVEVFDPGSGRFTEVARLATGRGGHTATRLADGRVLLAGGADSRQALSTVELFDPATNRITAVAPMPAPRAAHAAARLADGRVLVAGGQSVPGHGRGIVGSALVYDPARDAWTPVGPLGQARYKTALVPLPDGGALVVGGQAGDAAAARLASTERYDPATTAFAAGPTLSEPRYKISDAVLVLRDGRVAVAGGFGVDVLTGPTVRTIAPGDPVERLFPTATELADGAVLVTGGSTERTRVTATAFLVRP